jgi:hypothetical protein
MKVWPTTRKTAGNAGALFYHLLPAAAEGPVFLA